MPSRSLRTEFERDQIAVFDLTKLKGNAHSRAFDNVTSVAAMVRQRFGEGRRWPSGRPI